MREDEILGERLYAGVYELIVSSWSMCLTVCCQKLKSKRHLQIRVKIAQIGAVPGLCAFQGVGVDCR